MTNKYKPRGWFNDSHRHSLAAKGIPTRYNANKYDGLYAHKAPDKLKGTRVSWINAAGETLYVDVESMNDAKELEKVMTENEQGSNFTFEPVEVDDYSHVDLDAKMVNFDAHRETKKPKSNESMFIHQHSENEVLGRVTDIPTKIQDSQSSVNEFSLKDAAIMPGALVKDAGSTIGDMARFAGEVVRRE